MANYLLSQFENDKKGIWETNMFGKSLYELVNESLQSKIEHIPTDAQNKLRKTLKEVGVTDEKLIESLVENSKETEKLTKRIAE